MSRINVLPLNLRNKIAAGEVVERPASVVKELMENSIDAESTRIEIDIAKAGRRLIKVSDKGIGMDREDALLAFERYATSKIKDEDDLFNIRTMGFRGEALSSIASVSKVCLITAAQIPPPLLKGGKGGLIGTCIEIIGGETREIKDCSAIGTTIEIKDLFFNTPARRKFLKSDGTENYHIIDTVTREAISHYQIGFVLRMDGDEVLSLPSASSCRERLMQIFGKEFVDDLIEAETEDGQKDGKMSIKAFLGKTTSLRNNKNNQFLFINNRPVKDQSMTYAVYKAYEGLIPKDKHPVFFLFMEINPKKVDFNVHPTKREVRFEDKSSIFDFVYQTVKAVISHQSSVISQDAGYMNEKAEYSFAESCILNPIFCNQVAEPQNLCYSDYMESVPFLYLGDTFVAIAGSGGLTIIDYHAAHERINYERLLKRIDMPSYKLLFPQQVKPQVNEYRVILENIQLLNEVGMEVGDFGHGTLIVRSLPEFLRDADLNALMSDMAAALIDEGQGLRACPRMPLSGVKGQGNDMLEPIDSVRKVLAAKLACHSSIRGREVPDGIRIAQLLKDLDAAENPNTCPHGRPTRIFISMDELRKMFKK